MAATLDKISPEVMDELWSIHEQIKAYRAKINELTERMDELVLKHDLAYCRELGCKHTYQRKDFCHCHSWCLRSKWSHGAWRDCYEPAKKPVKLPTNYPTLGWKQVATRGMKWNGVWHGFRKVVKETDKTLILDNKEQLLKSTIYTIEDCTFIKNRMGGTYLCADDPTTLDMQVILLDVAHKEWCERNSLNRVKSLDIPLASEVDGMKL